MAIFEEMAQAVVKGNEKACVELAQKALDDGIDPVEAIQEGFSKGMAVIGEDFESGKAYLPEMMLAAKAMNGGVAILEPAIEAKGGETQQKGRVLLATIHGDMHDIGKNIVKLLMSTSGFEIIDLGKDVRVATIVDEAQARRADIIGVSALMTTTMGYMPVLMEELTFAGIRDKYKVMVGGAPVTAEWADEIGSDGYAKDAVGAVRVARELLDN
jgi:corrinoid protein of di/trimethylamine methyltransferase